MRFSSTRRPLLTKVFLTLSLASTGISNGQVPFPAGRLNGTPLEAAATNLFSGRSYLKNFPNLDTRKKVRESFLGVDQEGLYSVGSGKAALLATAIDRSVEARQSDATALSDKAIARRIADESLEALLTGQMLAGNFNLLKGLRVAFPSTNESVGPKGETKLPVGGPQPSNLTPANERDPLGGFNGARVTDLIYAENHFMRGISEAMLFMQQDPVGTIRASDTVILGSFPQFTTYNNDDELRDPNFTTTKANKDENRPMQVAGYQLGNMLDRYGKATSGVAEKLWKGAYADRDRNPEASQNGDDPPSRPHERKEMLDAAVGHLRQQAHFQYLATLPLAATFSDTKGTDGESEFESCRINESRVTVDASAGVIERIRRGERPKLDAFNLNASKSDIVRKISDLSNTLKPAADAAYALADLAIWRENDGENQQTLRRQQLRTQFTSQLRRLCAIDPGVAGQSPYFGLTSQDDRVSYQFAVYRLIDDLLAAPATDPRLTSSGELGKVIIQLRAAQANIRTSEDALNAIPQQIKGVEDKVKAINGIILGTEDEVSGYRLSMAMAQAYRVSVTTGVEIPLGGPPKFVANATFSYDPGAIPGARYQNKIGRAEALKQVAINNAEEGETIRGLLLQQNQAALRLEESVIQGQLAIANVHSTLDEIDLLVSDHKYYIEGDSKLWFNDAGLVFEREKAELDYESALDAYRRALYELSQMLAARWAEPFENPYFNRGRFGRSLPVAYDAFTQPESVFNIVSTQEATTFFNALKEWDSKLRDERDGGASSREVTLSLRQDIKGFSDLVWNGSSLVTNSNAAVIQNNKRAFRAWLIAGANPGGTFRLRLNFGTTFAQPGLQRRAAPNTDLTIFRSADFEWNHRITSIKAKVIGSNLGGSADGIKIPIQLYQYGLVQVPAYFPRSVDKLLRPLNLPLYYTDPQVGSNSPYQFALESGIGESSNPAGAINVSNDVEPSPFCENWILLVSNQNTLPLNLNNWDDIKLIFTVESGQPPPFWP